MSGKLKYQDALISSISRSAVYQNWCYVRRMYNIFYSKYEDIWSIPLTISAGKKKERQGDAKTIGENLREDELKNNGKASEKSKSCKKQTCFFYDCINVSLMTDFAPRTPGLGGGAAAAYFGIKRCQ
jgi:hypothetical protein